jgi:hypothetical protein
MNSFYNHIPFNSIEEINLHIDISNVLITRVKDAINQIPEVNPELRIELETHIASSLNVLIEGYTNMLHSIEQGCIK